MLQVSDLRIEFGIEALWRKGLLGQDVVLALLDSGVRRGPLGDRFVAEVDMTDDNDPSDFIGHGSKMAGFVLDYAEQAKIISIKVIDKNGSVSRENAAKGLRYCMEHYPNVRLINMSFEIDAYSRIGRNWCCSESEPCILCKEVERTSGSGRFLVAAAGNRALPYLDCPARAAGALPVAGSARHRKDSRIQRFLAELLPSQHGESGTSTSAALVTGGIAVLLSAFPDLEVSELRKANEETGYPIQGGPPRVREMHFYRAFKYLVHRRAGKPLSESLSQQHFDKGRALLFQGLLIDSIDELEKATSLCPYASSCFGQLGVALLQNGQIEKSHDALMESLALDWRSAPSHLNFGWICDTLGQRNVASLHYLVAVALDPNIRKNIAPARLEECLRHFSARRMYVVYERPLDHPEGFVVREFHHYKGTFTPANVVTHAENLEEARRVIPKGCIRVDRIGLDDPVIVESWIQEG